MKRAFAFGDKSIEAAVRRVNDVRCVAIIGAGTMGQGIAIDLLKKTDYALILLDVQAEALDRARTRLSQMWATDVRESRLRPEEAKRAAERTTFTQSYDDLARTDVVWEVATERGEIKAKIFEAIEKNIDPDRIAAISPTPHPTRRANWPCCSSRRRSARSSSPSTVTSRSNRIVSST